MQPDPQESNPYASSTLAADAKRKKPPGFRPLAVLVGWLADMVFSFVIAIILGMIVGAMLLSQGVQPERLQEKIQDLMWLQVAGLILGCAGTMFGGFVGAWMGKVQPILHAFAVGLVSLVIGAVSVAVFPEAQPAWASIAGIALAVPSALLGGLLCSATQTAKA